mgnify:CR=1 FL=1
MFKEKGIRICRHEFHELHELHELLEGQCLRKTVIEGGRLKPIIGIRCPNQPAGWQVPRMKDQWY